MGSKSLYGIIGSPLNHSLSPVMHNAAFDALEVPAEYRLFPLEPDELDDFFEDLRGELSPIFGLNVTVPYKQDVLKYMDGLNPFAEKAGAVNTIVIDKERKFHGYNTDGPGFLAHLEELNFNPTDKRIAILGAGGTTRAILAALCMIPERPMNIMLYNRTFENGVTLAADLAQRLNLDIVNVVENVEDLNIEIADLLINTTSVGLHDDVSIIDPELLHSNLLVYDVIYKTGGTQLLKDAGEKGAQTTNGLAMLYYQGILAFQRWAELEPEDSVKQIMRDALEKAAIN